MTAPTMIVPGARLAFGVIDVPEIFQNQPNSPKRYSGTLLIPKTDTALFAKVKAAMLAAAVNKWKEKGQEIYDELVAGLRTCVTNGDKRQKYDGFAGHWAIAAHAREATPPTLVQTVNGKNVKLDRLTQSVIYSGCYVNASIEFWAQDNAFGKRINCTLRGLQWAADGEAFGGARPASEDEFDIVEGVPAGTSDIDKMFEAIADDEAFA